MLIRKIKSIGCWDPAKIKEKINRDDATTPGDAIADLKTDHNSLSVWYTPDLDEKNVLPVIAAIAASRDSIQKVTYVVLDEDRLTELEIKPKQVEGLAPGIEDESILSRHYDLINIDYKRLGLLATYIQDLVDAKTGKTVSDKRLMNYINEMIEKGKINKDNLKAGIKQSLESDDKK